jgi:hypothetical protein
VQQNATANEPEAFILREALRDALQIIGMGITIVVGDHNEIAVREA